MTGPEDNPADEHRPTKEEWEKTMTPTVKTGGSQVQRVQRRSMAAAAHQTTMEGKIRP